jgi:hypothetical protein
MSGIFTSGLSWLVDGISLLMASDVFNLPGFFIFRPLTGNGRRHHDELRWTWLSALFWMGVLALGVLYRAVRR